MPFGRASVSAGSSFQLRRLQVYRHRECPPCSSGRSSPYSNTDLHMCRSEIRSFTRGLASRLVGAQHLRTSLVLRQVLRALQSAPSFRRQPKPLDLCDGGVRLGAKGLVVILWVRLLHASNIDESGRIGSPLVLSVSIAKRLNLGLLLRPPLGRCWASKWSKDAARAPCDGAGIMRDQRCASDCHRWARPLWIKA